MPHAIAPGAILHRFDEPDRGLGEVQSVIGRRGAADFEGAGKVLVDTDHLDPIVVEDQAVAW